MSHNSPPPSPTRGDASKKQKTKTQFIDRKKQYRDDHQTPPLNHPGMKHTLTLLICCVALLGLLGIALYGMQLAVPWSPLSTDAEAIFECLIPRIDVRKNTSSSSLPLLRSGDTGGGEVVPSTSNKDTTSSNEGSSSSLYPGEEYGHDRWEFVNLSCKGHIGHGNDAAKFSSTLVVDNETNSFLFHSSPASFSDGHYQGLFRGKIIVLVVGCLILVSCPLIGLQSYRMERRRKRKAANENSALLESGDERDGSGAGMPRFFYYGEPPSPPLLLGCLALIGGQRTAETSFDGARKGRRYLRLWTATLFLVIILAFSVVVAFTALTVPRVTHCSARRCYSILHKEDRRTLAQGHINNNDMKKNTNGKQLNEEAKEEERVVHCEDLSNEVCPTALVGYFIYQGEKFHLALKHEANVLTPEEKRERREEEQKKKDHERVSSAQSFGAASSFLSESSGGSDDEQGSHDDGKKNKNHHLRDVTSIFDPVPSRDMLSLSVGALSMAFLPLMFFTMYLWNKRSKDLLKNQERRATDTFHQLDNGAGGDSNVGGGVRQALKKQYEFHGMALYQTLAASEQPHSGSFTPPKSGESDESHN